MSCDIVCFLFKEKTTISVKIFVYKKDLFYFCSIKNENVLN
jgi:hypothetical protein